MKYFKFIHWVIIIVLLSVMSISKCSRDNHIEKPFDSTIVYKSKLEAIQKQGEKEKEQWGKDSLELVSRADRFKIVASKATKERDIVRAKIQEIVNTVPEVREFVRVDSVADQIARDRIGELEFDQAKIIAAFNERLSIKTEELKLSYNLNGYLQSENDRLNKDVKRERLRKTFWQVVAGIAVTGLAFSSLNN